MALDRFIEQIGITRTTVWRWERNGLLKTFLIYGRRYISAEAVDEFCRRAEAGEFAGNRNVPKPWKRVR